MSGDRRQARLHLAIRRQADIQLGLGALALVAAATGAWWLLQDRLHLSVWLGVAGALTLAATFLAEGRRAGCEYARRQPPDASATTMSLGVSDTKQQGAPPTQRRRLLGFLVFGIVGSVGGPGLNILLRILTRGGAGPLDLLAWVLFTLPIALAVWILPPRGLGRKSEARSG